MIFTRDMQDLINLFSKYQVKYVLVGGYAVNYYGYVRTTLDIDFLIYPSKKNAKKVMAALEEFGFGKAGIPKDFFEKKGGVVHLGVEPNRIDLLTHLPGIDNDQIFKNYQTTKIEDITVNIIALEDLIQSKKKSKRLRDMADAEELEKINKN